MVTQYVAEKGISHSYLDDFKPLTLNNLPGDVSESLRVLGLKSQGGHLLSTSPSVCVFVETLILCTFLSQFFFLFTCILLHGLCIQCGHTVITFPSLICVPPVQIILCQSCQKSLPSCTLQRFFWEKLHWKYFWDILNLFLEYLIVQSESLLCGLPAGGQPTKREKKSCTNKVFYLH